MTDSSSQIGMDFFFKFDNAFFQPFKQGDPEDYDAVLPGMNVASAFYLSQEQFDKAIQANRGSLEIVGGKTIQLVQETLGGDWDNSLRQAWENFGQGLLWDDRRNTPEYLFWAVHTMDSIAKSQADEYGAQSFGPSEYYSWYAANRGISQLGIGESGKWLNFGRFLAMAAAIQNVAKPWCAVGPTAYSLINPTARRQLPPIDQPWSDQLKKHNKAIPDTVARIRDLYAGCSQDQLDNAFRQAKSLPHGQAGELGNPIQVPPDY